MTETRTAERVGLTLELEPEPVNAPAIAEQKQPAAAHAGPSIGADNVGRSPLDTITDLLNRGITVEMLDQFLKLQREWERDEARKAYHRAVAAFKREDIPAIVKRVHVDYPTRGRDGGPPGRVEYDHETLDEVVFAVLGPMARHGLTHKWIPEQKSPPSGMITVRCELTHELGHSEFVELSAAPDTSGQKNAIQAVKSAISYLERITLLAITGLAARGMDDDGRGAGAPVESGEARSRGKPRTTPPRATDERPAAGSPPAEGVDPEFVNGYEQGARGVATAKQVGLIKKRAGDAGVPMNAILAEFEIGALEELPRALVDDALEFIRRGGRGARG